MAWNYLASWAKALGLTTTNLTKYICDNLNYLKGVAGPVDIDNDLWIKSPITGKGIRFRRSGSALDIDFVGDGSNSFDVWFNWGVSSAALSNKLKIDKNGNITVVGTVDGVDVSAHAAASAADGHAGLGLSYTATLGTNRKPTDTQGWQTVTLSELPDGVAFVEMQLYCTAQASQQMGTRPVGSSAGRLVMVDTLSSCIMLCSVNASKQLQIYSYGSGAATNANYRPYGWFM